MFIFLRFFRKHTPNLQRNHHFQPSHLVISRITFATLKKKIDEWWLEITTWPVVLSWVRNCYWNLSLEVLSPPHVGSTVTVIFQLLDQPSIEKHLTTSPKRSGEHLQLLHLCPRPWQMYAAQWVHQATCKMGVNNFFAFFCHQFHEFEVSSSN